MLPDSSWAYQSSVTSTLSPLLSVTMSRTTRAVTPLASFFVLSVTVTTTRSRSPAVFVSRYTHLLPGFIGQ